MLNVCTLILVGVVSGFGDIATFQIWPIIVNPFSFSPSPSLLSSPPPPPPPHRFITGSLVSLNDITISLQLHTDQQMTNTRTLY